LIHPRGPGRRRVETSIVETKPRPCHATPAGALQRALGALLLASMAVAPKPHRVDILSDNR
jgi:hypothetical protein